MKKLRLLANGSIMLPNYKAHEAGARRYIGRQYDPSVGPAGGWPSTGKPEEVDCLAEYIIAVRQGDVLPADSESAALCGVPFDSSSFAESVKASPAEKSK